jgi:hypothetical protein
MANLSPEARIIYIVRDPVERSLSHYRYHVQAGYERLSCLDALRSDPIYCSVSNYAMQIEPFIARFGWAGVRIVLLEELARDSAAQLRALFEWLDVPPGDADHTFPKRNAVPQDVLRPRGPDLLHDRQKSAGIRRGARSILPEGLRPAVRRLLTRRDSSATIRSPEVMSYLRSTHEPHALALEDLLGRTVADWTTLRPAPPADVP